MLHLEILGNSLLPKYRILECIFFSKFLPILYPTGLAFSDEGAVAPSAPPAAYNYCRLYHEPKYECPHNLYIR